MYKYTLEKKSIKHICPRCYKKRFVRYVDSETNEYLSHLVGRCDRELNCAYHYPPKYYFKDLSEPYFPILENRVVDPKLELRTSFHNSRELERTLINNGKNNLIQFLHRTFDQLKVAKMLKDYKVGTASNWHNATIFWQIDEEEKIRGGKIISYTQTGKRTKYINWVHAIQIKNRKINSFHLRQCLFGLHLLNHSQKIIAIVESEKTACIMSLLFDKYLWLATGSLGGLTENKLKPIIGRKIILYPDLGVKENSNSPFEQWYLKQKMFEKKGFDIAISDLLERKGTDKHRQKGYDIADYFLDNKNNKPRKIISEQQQKYIEVYMKNQNLKTLIDVFDLLDENGNRINFHN
ncbi:DUF6371 domain-containing protein [Gramella sp. Hel_I_59]|uniref:DUF6371 domain-containing protein n=1 Tax=Gramella sp. Hel_I_59 TaxID=1249978 RepID=UPI00163AEE94|nr:DUF6371 domain-containing protein [Gramella sp. Hel_I_59]